MTRRRLSPETRRAQLVDAAIDVFASRPEDEVGLEDLAAAAGVTRNLLYRYFESRGALQLAAVREAISRLAATMDIDPATPLDVKFARNNATWLDAAERGDPALLLVLRAAHSQDPAVAALAHDSRVLFARAIAFNHLGDPTPEPTVLAALEGYLTLSESLIESWRAGELDRPAVERILAAVLPALIAAARPPEP